MELNSLITAGVLVACYLSGAIPFGLIISKQFYGVDIRTVGSGNPGATNVWRTIGKGPGILTLALDALKGFAPVWLVRLGFPESLWLPILSGVACIAGHNWSVFLLGSGGKGVATSAGVFLALIPPHMGIALLSFLVLFLATGHVSVGSMGAAVALFFSTFFIPTEPLHRIMVALASAMILIKHLPNIRRIARGEEPRVKFR